MFPPKLLALLINANDRCFGCPRSYPREPPGHTPPAFLFLSSTMSNSGEDLVTLRSDASDTNRYRSPCGRYRQLLASCIRNAHRNVDADERRASLSGRGYRWDSLGVSSDLSQNFCARKNTSEIRVLPCRATTRSDGRRAGPVDEPPAAAISPRLRPSLAWLTEPKPSVAKLKEPAIRGD